MQRIATDPLCEIIKYLHYDTDMVVLRCVSKQFKTIIDELLHFEMFLDRGSGWSYSVDLFYFVNSPFKLFKWAFLGPSPTDQWGLCQVLAGRGRLDCLQWVISNSICHKTSLTEYLLCAVGEKRKMTAKWLIKQGGVITDAVFRAATQTCDLKWIKWVYARSNDSLVLSRRISDYLSFINLEYLEWLAELIPHCEIEDWNNLASRAIQKGDLDFFMWVYSKASDVLYIEDHLDFAQYLDLPIMVNILEGLMI